MKFTMESQVVDPTMTVVLVVSVHENRLVGKQVGVPLINYQTVQRFL